jgi:hypothetical protein
VESVSELSLGYNNNICGERKNFEINTDENNFQAPSTVSETISISHSSRRSISLEMKIVFPFSTRII